MSKNERQRATLRIVGVLLVLNLDNGPENHSHRTQFMARLMHAC